MHLNSLALLAPILLAPTLAISADRYRIDPDHTFPSIEFSHMGISTWRGKFTRSSGQIVLDRAAATGSVEVDVDTASIDFGLARMEQKARGEEYFNVAKFPTARYRGTLRFEAGEPRAVEGELTLLGVTRPLMLLINSLRCVPSPLTNKEVCGADAEGELEWTAYGIHASRSGASRVRLRIQVEAQKQD